MSEQQVGLSAAELEEIKQRRWECYAECAEPEASMDADFGVVVAEVDRLRAALAAAERERDEARKALRHLLQWAPIRLSVREPDHRAAVEDARALLSAEPGKETRE